MADEILQSILAAKPTDDFRQLFLDQFEVSAQTLRFILNEGNAVVIGEMNSRKMKMNKTSKE